MSWNSPAPSEIVGVVRRIPIDKLFTDSYCRTVNLRKVREIAANWQESAAQAIVVSERLYGDHAGQYAILDGLHRKAAGHLAGVRELTCLVMTDLTYAREAELFVLLNNKTNPSPSHIFKARVAARFPAELDMQQIAAGYGLHISTETSAGSVRIASVGGVDAIYREYGGYMLDAVLGILKEAFEGDTAGYKLSALLGLAAFLVRYHRIVDRRRIVSKLRAVGPSRMQQRAALLQETYRGTRGLAWGRALHAEYNNKLQHKLPDWSAKVTPAMKQGVQVLPLFN